LKEIHAWYGKRHHTDFGLISPRGSTLAGKPISLEKVKEYVGRDQWRRVAHDDFAWASLNNFWCVKGLYLARRDHRESDFNAVVGRNQDKRNAKYFPRKADSRDRWLAGEQGVSKKVFSFKEPVEARRTFGFVRDAVRDLDRLFRRFGSASWPDSWRKRLLKGPEILQELGAVCWEDSR